MFYLVLIWRSVPYYIYYKMEDFAASKGMDLDKHNKYGMYTSSAATELVPHCLQLKRLLVNRASCWPAAVSVCLNACAFHQCSSTEVTLCCHVK